MCYQSPLVVVWFAAVVLIVVVEGLEGFSSFCCGRLSNYLGAGSGCLVGPAVGQLHAQDRVRGLRSESRRVSRRVVVR